jgi:putative colanic acid biosynthesis UDP-glucose lipid carrier transferase
MFKENPQFDRTAPTVETAVVTSSPRIQPQSSLWGALYRVSDVLCILAALRLATAIRPLADPDQFLLAAAAATVVFFLTAEVTGMYRSWRGVSTERELVCALITWAFTLLVVLAIGYLTAHAGNFSRGAMLLCLITTPLLIALSRTLSRLVQRFLRARGYNTRGVAVVGVNELGIQLARNIEQSPELGLKLIGFYDDRPEDRTGEVPEEVGARIGDLAELVEQARAGRVNLIYITFPMRAEERIGCVLGRLSDSTASVYIVPDFFVYELLHSRWTSIGGLPAVSVFENPFYGVDGVVKRVSDLVLGALALALAGVPMLIVALLIKLTSPGPVFFRQRRYGLDGREILVWKFRSMRVCEDGEKVTQAVKNDSRVTPLGAVLRKTSLDELPQLFNVLEGSMSLVGPRPHASAHNEQYRPLIHGYMLRHKVKPGITGLAQVSGWRGETDTLEKMERRVECDHRYIRDWSLWLDLRILLQTALVVLSRKNAY